MRIRRLAASVTGPRGRWVTVAVWIGVAGFVARAHIGEVTARRGRRRQPTARGREC